VWAIDTLPRLSSRVHPCRNLVLGSSKQRNKSDHTSTTPQHQFCDSPGQGRQLARGESGDSVQEADSTGWCRVVAESGRTCDRPAKRSWPKTIRCTSSARGSSTQNGLQRSTIFKSPTTTLSQERGSAPDQNRCGTAPNQLALRRGRRMIQTQMSLNAKKNGRMRKHATVRDGRYWIRTSDFHRVKMAL
jgi:hypothetical protein